MKSIGMPGVALVVLTILGASTAAAKSTTGSTDAGPVQFQAFAVNMNPPTGGAGSIDITIDRWTSDAERMKLCAALTEQGGDALLRALQDTKKVGSIRATGGGLGWSIQYARKTPLPDGGYRVVIGTDRPMSFDERASQPRSADFQFLIAELRIGKDGQGEGRLFPAAKVSFDKGENAIEIENLANEPVQLTKVTELRPHKKDTKDKASQREP